jgi:hypothetical protein
MAATNVGGTSAPSMDLLLAQMQQSQADGSRESIKAAQDRHELYQARAEAARADLKKKEGEVENKQSKLDEHAEKEPDLLDKLIFHRHEHEAKKLESDVNMSHAEVDRASIKLERAREEQQQALEDARESLQAGMARNDELEGLLEQNADTMLLIAGGGVAV